MINRVLLAGGLAFAGAWVGWASTNTAPSYINNGPINFGTNAPQVDATNFINNGTFSVSSSLGFDTQNTLNFTNRGTMSGSIGFKFDHVADDGTRTPAANFVNTATGSIQGSDGFGVSSAFGGGSFGLTSGGSLISISATNVQSHGLLSVGAGGLLKITGQEVNLTNGAFIVEPVASSMFGGRFGGLGGAAPCVSDFSMSESNFFPDTAVYDEYWGSTEVTNLSVDKLVSLVVNTQVTVLPVITNLTVTNLVGTNLVVTNQTVTNFTFTNIVVTNPAAISPQHQVTNGFGGFRTSVQLSPATYSWALTNAVSDTNTVIQAVFVSLPTTNLTAGLQWVSATYPGGGPSPNDFLTAVVEIGAPGIDLATGEPKTNQFYLIDQMATSTNHSILTNQVNQTGRPGNFIVSRTAPCPYVQGGTSSNAVVTPDLFYNDTFTNKKVTAIYSGYSATLGTLATQFPTNVPGADLSQLPGRVEIDADNLDLNRARIRGEGLVTIKARNLVGSTKTIIDAQNLTYDLASTNGTLDIKNLAEDTAERFGGTFSAYSVIWTNQAQVVQDSGQTDPNTGEPVSTTNNVEVAYHVLMVDGSQLFRDLPVHINDFSATSTNAPSLVTLSDNLDVVKSFKIDAQNLLVKGNLVLGSGLRWRGTNFVGLLNLTNQGRISVQGEADYGEDVPTPYDSLVNQGSISAFSHFIRAKYFENDGSIVSGQDYGFGTSKTVGPIHLEADTVKLSGGRFVTGGDILLNAQTVNMQQYTNNVDGSLTLDVSDTLDDGGLNGSNVWSVGNGINLTTLPAHGNLLGTSVQLVAKKFGIINNLWKAEDKGATAAGYSDNMAIGQLTLQGDVDSAFTFSGDSTNQALYVDQLRFAGWTATNLENSLVLENGFQLYFADVQSSDTNSPVTPADLDGKQFGNGTLHWVQDFAGPYSGVQVTLVNGTTTYISQSLKDSTVIDSDGDGVVNANDQTPFIPDGGIKLLSFEIAQQGTQSQARFSWNAAPLTTYEAQFNSDLGSTNWQGFATFTNSTLNATNATVTQDLPADASQRYYRLQVQP